MCRERERERVLLHCLFVWINLNQLNSFLYISCTVISHILVKMLSILTTASSDILESIVQHLPYPSLGRLAKTCKRMNGNITAAQVEKARERGRELFGRVQIIREIGRTMLRIFNTDEQPIVIGKLSRASPIIILRKDGRLYLGSSMRDHLGNGFASGFDRISRTFVFDHFSGTESSLRLWYLIRASHASENCLLLKFRTRDSNGEKHFDVIFDEFVQ